MRPTAHVFVSSTWKDLQPVREAVEAALQRMRETKFCGMEHFGLMDEFPRSSVLAALAPHLAALHPTDLYPLWRETLHLSSRRPRSDLLLDIGALVPVIVALGGHDALADTARAIGDVCRWWP